MLKSILFLFILVIVYSCSNSTSPNSNLSSSFQQLPGCNNNLLSKTTTNSSFSYAFNTYADILFTLPSNCCPDNNRFDNVTLLNDNVITITVIDTAAHLCRCTCNYELNLKLDELTESSYRIVCVYGDSIYYDEKIYRD